MPDAAAAGPGAAGAADVSDAAALAFPASQQGEAGGSPWAEAGGLPGGFAPLVGTEASQPDPLQQEAVAAEQQLRREVLELRQRQQERRQQQREERACAEQQQRQREEQVAAQAAAAAAQRQRERLADDPQRERRLAAASEATFHCVWRTLGERQLVGDMDTCLPHCAGSAMLARSKRPAAEHATWRARPSCRLPHHTTTGAGAAGQLLRGVLSQHGQQERGGQAGADAAKLRLPPPQTSLFASSAVPTPPPQVQPQQGADGVLPATLSVGSQRPAASSPALASHAEAAPAGWLAWQPSKTGQRGSDAASGLALKPQPPTPAQLRGALLRSIPRWAPPPHRMLPSGQVWLHAASTMSHASQPQHFYCLFVGARGCSKHYPLHVQPALLQVCAPDSLPAGAWTAPAAHAACPAAASSAAAWVCAAAVADRSGGGRPGGRAV